MKALRKQIHDSIDPGMRRALEEMRGALIEVNAVRSVRITVGGREYSILDLIVHNKWTAARYIPRSPVDPGVMVIERALRMETER